MTTTEAALRAALEKCRDQFQFYATEHKAKSDAAYKAWDDARYLGNVDEQNAAHKEYHKRLTQTQTNEAMVVMIDNALSQPSPASSPVGEVGEIVAWLREQSEKGAAVGITEEKGTFARGAYGGASLVLKRAANMIESGEYRALSPSSDEPAPLTGEVDQVDRDAAANFWASYAGLKTEFSRKVRRGESDGHGLTRAFMMHRHAQLHAEPASVDDREINTKPVVDHEIGFDDAQGQPASVAVVCSRCGNPDMMRLRWR